LRAFGRDLTELAKRGELDPVIGRNNEIERVIQILCRRTKNNLVLLGEAGVGKTAIVEGLAQENHGWRLIFPRKVLGFYACKMYPKDSRLNGAGSFFRGLDGWMVEQEFFENGGSM
jgi:hypothetical protein